MLFKQSSKNVLEHYGLSRVLNTIIYMFRDEDGVLHMPDYCAVNQKDFAHGTVGTNVHMAIKDIVEECCICLREDLEVAAAAQVVRDFSEIYELMQGPIPAFTSYNKISEACYIVEQMFSLLDRTQQPWFTVHPFGAETFKEACAKLKVYASKLQQQIFLAFENVGKEYGVATLVLKQGAAAEFNVEKPNVEGPDDFLFEDPSFASDGLLYILVCWQRLVANNVSVKDRHRFTMKIAGGALMGANHECNLPSENAQVVVELRRISSLILQLETELAAELAREPETFLVVAQQSIFNSEVTVLAEKYALRSEGYENKTWLLSVPGYMLCTFADLDDLFTYSSLPPDDKIREFVIKMWEPNPSSVLHSPANLIDLAHAVLK